MENKYSKQIEIDLMQLLRALWQHLWVILIAAVIAGCAMCTYASVIITPLYEGQVLLYVNNSSFSLGNTSFSITSSELTAAQSLVDTYIVILKTRSTLNKVINQANLSYNYQELSEMIQSGPVNNTEVFSIKVTSDSPQEAELIANTIAEILPNKIADIVDGSSVRVVDYAIVPAEKKSPNITLYTAIGAFVGIILTCLVIIIREMMDTQIHDDEYLLQVYDLPVLAIIPNLFNSGSSGYYNEYEAPADNEKE